MKRVLIVDDEKIVVDALKEGFRRYEEKLFQTDIAYTAEDAIAMIESTSYALVVSDIRLPQQTGIDILLKLKKLQPEAGFIAMTAFSNPEVEQQVNTLGGIKYLEKPFSFDVLESLVLGFIKGKSKSAKGLTDSLELTSILQLINMESKTLTLGVRLDGKYGYIVFEEGEIIDAAYDDMSGLDAAMYMIARNEGDVGIDTKKRATSRTISIPFMNLLLDSMKEKDEKARKKTPAKKKRRQPDVSSLTEKLACELEKLAGVKGFVSAGAFGPDGECIFETSQVKGSSLKEMGEGFVNFFRKASEAIAEAGFGVVNMTQVDSVKGIFFARRIQIDSMPIGLLVNLSLDGNVAMAKMGLAEAVSSLERADNDQ